MGYYLAVQPHHHMTIIGPHQLPRPSCCCSAANQITTTRFQLWVRLFKVRHGPILQHWLHFTACPEVSSLCCRSPGLCDLQVESIVLREFTVSEYVASALGRLEKYRGNATLHGVFMQYWSLLPELYHSVCQTGANIQYDALCEFWFFFFVFHWPVRLKNLNLNMWMVMWDKCWSSSYLGTKIWTCLKAKYSFLFFSLSLWLLSSHLFASLRRFELQRIGGSVAAAVTC